MIAWLITSKLGRALAAAGALLLAVVTFGALKKREGRQEAENEALRDDAKKQEEGRDAVQDLRGADRDQLTDKLRDNNKRW